MADRRCTAQWKRFTSGACQPIDRPPRTLFRGLLCQFGDPHCFTLPGGPVTNIQQRLRGKDQRHKTSGDFSLCRVPSEANFNHDTLIFPSFSTSPDLTTFYTSSRFTTTTETMFDQANCTLAPPDVHSDAGIAGAGVSHQPRP